MRHVGVLVLAAGCGFHMNSNGSDGGGGSDAAGTASLIDDTAADFAASDTLDGGVIDPLGSIAPQVLALAGFHARAYDGKHVAGTTTSWAQIETEVAGASVQGAGYQQMPANWGSSRPHGLALTADDNWTVIFEGELEIPAGDHTISLDADDAGAMEIDRGSGFEGFTLDAAGGAVTLQFHADQAGWMPFHAAVGEGTGNAQLKLQLDGDDLAPDQVRARATGDTGMIAAVYYGVTGGVALAGMAHVVGPNVNFGMVAPPYDLPNTPTAYTVNFIGQVRIDVDGTYTIAPATAVDSDSSTVYVDKHMVARAPASGGFPAAATVQLTAGWHDLAISLSASQTGFFGEAEPHNVTLATTIARDGGPPIPLSAMQLRPAASSSFITEAISAVAPLADTDTNNGVTTIGLPAPIPAVTGATIESATVGYGFKHATYTDYSVSLDEAGTALMIPPTNVLVAVIGDETGAGQPVPAANGWTYTFTDTVPGNAAGFPDPQALGLAVYTYHGGPLEPFAPKVTYISSARELTGITAFGAFTITGALDGATATYSVRTAATADALAAATWVDVASGAVPTAAALPFVQYRIVLAGDGWQYPHVDRIELDYTR
jgi:hypothetical protein